MRARAVMVLGTTSGAGKSWLATAVCRWAARQGLRVAPFKAQNMSNNARVVARPDGGWGEIGSAQYFQALAAHAQPDVRMNPILLKPESDTGSQVVVCGEVHRIYSTMPWRERSELLWPHARQALHELMAQNDLVVIEGAGSPAEINLHQSDYVNMRTALEVNAQCLVVTDIDRGGAFAHLYGTHQLLPSNERALIRGFVLNRFRGDATLLSPGPEQLQALTGVPTVAVLPYWRDHGLADEDGLDGGRWTPTRSHSTGVSTKIAVIAYPQISNLDEFESLRHLPNVDLIWARHPQELLAVDWIILPGSKRTQSDLIWLRQQGLDEPIRAHALSGRPVLGICGGLQMLGQSLDDPHGVDGGLVAQAGLGLLPIHTVFDPVKVVRPARMRFADRLPSAWSHWQSINWSGYEIHQGRTEMRSSDASVHALLRDDGQPLGWSRGQVMGLYAHGLFESSEILRAWLGSDCPTWDQVFDGLADFIDTHFEKDFLSQWLLR
ncbi:MAG: cobyric acid synthase [Burkholderiales bacterium]|nr:cobyric acid synthase [Burkholderiales bacterium]